MKSALQRSTAQLTLALAVLWSAPVLAQDSHDGERASTATAPAAPVPVGNRPYQSVRYLEDYSALATAPSTDVWDPLKYVALWPGGYLSLGGQHRLRYELVSPTNAGLAPDATVESVMLSRNLLHLDLHLAPQLRIFAQLGAYYALGAPTRQDTPDVDRLDVAQLFLEARAKLGGVQLIARAGRQEMPLGSTRWVSPRDGTSVRQAFDLVRLTLATSSWNLEAFYGGVPALKPGTFDDAPDPQNRFWGAYATIPVLPKKLLSVESFYLGRGRPHVTYRELSGREVRHTFGVRVYGQTSSGLEYIEHALLQVGSLGSANIRAWGLATALWQRLPGVLRPIRIGVRGDALSGDGHAGDGTASTFNPLFPNQTFFSALPAIYPSNLYDVHPLIRFEGETLTLESGCIFFWRQAVEDAVYQPPGPPLLTGAQTRAAFTGSQLSTSVAYKANRHLLFNAEFSHVFAGPAITQAGGGDVNFFGTWTTYTY